MASNLETIIKAIVVIIEVIARRPRLLARTPFSTPVPPKLPSNDRLQVIPADRQEQAWLVGKVKAGPPKEACYLVHINQAQGNSIRFLDLKAKDQGFEYIPNVAPAWFNFNAAIGQRLQMPNPGVPVTNAEGWRDFGVQQAAERGIKVVAAPIKRRLKS